MKFFTVVIAVLGAASSAFTQPVGIAEAQRRWEQGQYREAETAAQALVLQYENTSPENLAVTLDLLARVQLELESAPFPQIQTVIERNLALKEKLYGSTSAQYGQTILLRGQIRRQTNDAKGAEEDAVRARALCADKAECESEALRLLAALAANRAQYAKANEFGEEAVRLNERTLGPRAPLTALAVAELGTSNLSPDVEKARRLLDQAIEILRSDAAPQQPYLAYALTNRGSVSRTTGDYAGAKSLFEEGLRILETVYGPEHRTLIAPLNNLGLDLKTIGDYRGGRASLERAAQLAQIRYGPENFVSATILQNLAILTGEDGDLIRERELLDQALAIQKKTLGPDHPLVASTLNSIGVTLQQTGDYPAARDHFQRALALLQQKDGEKSPKTLEVMLSLADVEHEMSDFSSELKTATRAAELSSKYLGAESSRTTSALRAEGRALTYLGRPQEALNYLLSALRMDEKSGTVNIAITCEDLADVSLRLGRFDDAVTYSREAIDYITATSGRNTFRQRLPWKLLAEALSGLHRNQDALEAALESERVRREAQSALMAGLTERNALLSSLSTSSSLNVLVSLAEPMRDDASAVRQIWDAVIRSRALVLDLTAERGQISRRPGNAQLSLLVERLTRAREDLARALVRGSGSRDAKQYAERLRDLNAGEEKAEVDLASESVPFLQQETQRRAGLSEVAGALPAGTALVAFVRYEDFHETARYVAFVLNRQGASPIVVPLGPAARIEELVTRWRAEITIEMESQGRSQKVNMGRVQAAGEALRRAIWDPVAPYWKGSARLLLVPDGTLQMVNFAALPGPDGRYLVESGPLLHLLATERDLVIAPARTGRGLLAMGNPAFDAAPPRVASLTRGSPQSAACGDLAHLRFDPLPGSGGESAAVLRIWNKQYGEGSNVTGPQATLDAFKAMAPGKRVVHLATHGFFIEKACGANSVLEENPLLRGGLAFAGANLRREGTPDGILTASEVAQMDLNGTEWVVLSGCDTGSGQVAVGEGLLGLRRAFQVAGVRTVIGSLWPVQDEETRLWMTSLYGAHFTRGLDTAEAVRDAQLARLRARRAAGISTHPFYWGGFVAVGDWR